MTSHAKPPQSIPAPGTGLTRAALARAFGAGLAVVGVGLGAALAIDGIGERSAYLAGGAAAALFATGAAMLLQARFLGPRAVASFHGDPRLAATRLQSLLLSAFGLKLLVVVTVVLALRGAGVKFELSAAFAVAFAVASLLCQVVAAGVLARALSRPAVPAAANPNVASAEHP